MGRESAETLQDVHGARRSVAPRGRRTRLKFSRTLSKRMGASVYLKLETVHETGALKIRGAGHH